MNESYKNLDSTTYLLDWGRSPEVKKDEYFFFGFGGTRFLADRIYGDAIPFSERDLDLGRRYSVARVCDGRVDWFRDNGKRIFFKSAEAARKFAIARRDFLANALFAAGKTVRSDARDVVEFLKKKWPKERFDLGAFDYAYVEGPGTVEIQVVSSGKKSYFIARFGTGQPQKYSYRVTPLRSERAVKISYSAGRIPTRLLTTVNE